MNSSSPQTAQHPHSARPRSVMLLISILLVLSAAVITLARVAPSWGHVVILGIIEGITEFLPISSTGHLLIAADLLGFQDSLGGTFEIVIQLGAVLAVVVYYARDLIAQVRAVPTQSEARRFWLKILVAFLPAAVVGLLLRDFIKQVLFDSPTVIAWALIAGGMILITVERLPRHVAERADSTLSVKQAFAVGVAQVFALVPGVSRSGASIVGGMLAGLDRTSATRFSFYLAIPTLGAATVVDLLGSVDQLAAPDVARLALGAAVAFVVAWASIAWLLRYVANHSLVSFGVYRILAGLVLLGLVAIGWI